MKFNLSICIPTYNFAHCLSETLDSIVIQSRAREVEILILDGASTDETPHLIKNYQRYFPNIKYIRLPERGGIDRDIARAVTYSSGEYCWLFSGDDLMLPDAIGKTLNKIQTGSDLYLTRHFEWVDDQGEWVLWPTVDANEAKTFDLSLPADRRDYFTRAQNTEAFFSFIGGIIVRRSKWESVPINEKFVGSCWAQAARFFELMPGGLRVNVLAEPYLRRRPDNDSFGSGGITKRFALTIDGFTKIVNEFYGDGSFEAAQMRRVLRNEYHPLNMWLGKFLCCIDPDGEDIHLMDRLLSTLYGDKSFASWRVRFNYARVTPQRFRKWQPDLSTKFDAIKASKRAT